MDRDFQKDWINFKLDAQFFRPAAILAAISGIPSSRKEFEQYASSQICSLCTRYSVLELATLDS